MKEIGKSNRMNASAIKDLLYDWNFSKIEIISIFMSSVNP